MTFLELVSKAAEKCGISGTVISVAGNSGEFARMVNWVNESWHDIQLGNSNWDWMRYEFTFNTTANDDEYTPTEAGATLFSKWHTDTLRIFKTASGIGDEQFFVETDYLNFRNTYRFGPQVPGRPTMFAVKPRGSSLLIGLIPDDVYTIYGEYQRRPSYMAVDADVPDMPEEYHMAIVHAARIKYAAFENAPEVMSEAQRDYDRVMGNLASTQLGDISTGSPLA